MRSVSSVFCYTYLYATSAAVSVNVVAVPEKDSLFYNSSHLAFQRHLWFLTLSDWLCICLYDPLRRLWTVCSVQSLCQHSSKTNQIEKFETKIKKEDYRLATIKRKKRDNETMLYFLCCKSDKVIKHQR